MKKYRKRFIAFLCAVALILGMLPAGLIPVQAETSEETAIYKKVITSCDTLDEESNIVSSMTDGTNTWTMADCAQTDVKIEGAGAFKAGKASGKDASTLFNIFLHDKVDVKGYKYFSCQMYVDNVDNLGADTDGNVIKIHIRTSDNPSTANGTLTFVLQASDLKSGGWVEVMLPFEQAYSIQTTTDPAYNGLASWLNISTTATTKGAITAYIDDISVVNDEEGLLLADCDQKTGKLVQIAGDGELFKGTSDVAVKEGEGAWKSSAFLHSNSSTYRIQTQVYLDDVNKINIRDYVYDGYLQFWLYLPHLDYMNNGLTVELGSGGEATNNSVHFTIPKTELQGDWNLIRIPFGSESSTFGSIDYGAINYFRLLSIGVADATNYSEQYMILDDIRVVDVASEVEVRECVTGQVTPNEMSLPAVEGYVFGGYYNNYDADTKTFSNPLAEAREASEEAPVYAKWVTEDVMTVKAQVRRNENDDYKRVLTNCDGLDETSNISAKDKTETYNSMGKECTDVVYVQEGDGCLTINTTLNTKKADGSMSNPTFYNLFLEDSVDVRGYKYFSCQFYIPEEAYNNLKSSGNAIGILLSAEHDTSGNQSLIFYRSKAQLHEGWNDIKIPFSQAGSVSNSTSGVYDGSAIDYIRILQYGNSEGEQVTVQTYVDDICVLNDNPGVLIADFDQEKSDHAFASILQGNNTVTANTLTSENVKEGTGALKAAAYQHSDTNQRIMAPITMSDANRVDISAYKDTGYLQFMLYLNDKSNWSNKKFTVELRSNGNRDDAEIYWEVSANDLQDKSWNVVRLPLMEKDATSQPNGYTSVTATTDGQEFDWTKVNCFRIYLNPVDETDVSGGNYILIDDIRVVDSIQVADCDSTDELKTTSTGTSVVATTSQKVGQGAFINEDNTGALAHCLQLKQAVNFSGFKGTDEKTKNGSLRFWVYIEDVSFMKSDYLLVELTSEGARNDAKDQEYYIPKTRLVDGWNEVYINLDIDTGLSDTTESTLTDWTSVNCISIICNGGFSEACTTMIDDISLVPGNKEGLDVRFVSTVDSLGYRLVGYKITQSRSTTPLVTETKDVYSALYAMGAQGVRSSVTPTGVSGANCSTYIHAATVANIPNRLWDAEFTIIPYWMTLNGGTDENDGIVVEGAAKTYTMNYLLNKTEELKGQENTIDIYLIAGQSNAAGSTHIDCTANNCTHISNGVSAVDVFSNGTLEGVNSKYISGFENILYSGTSNTKTVSLTSSKANVHNNGMMGPEVGMAETLSTYYTGEDGRVAGLIKYAYGGTSLLDKENTETDKRQDERGNWVSPSYEAYLTDNGGIKHGEMTGKLYDNFMLQVETSLTEYKNAGYHPIIRGMYWMQGEDDRTFEEQYKIAFGYFATDVRNDLAELTGDEGLKEMPIIIGEISETFSNAVTQLTNNKTFIEMQHKLAEEIENCYIAYNGKYHINVVDETGESVYAEGVVDGAHWNWKDCLAIGNDVGTIIKKHILGITE